MAASPFNKWPTLTELAAFPLNKCPTEILSGIAGQLPSIRDVRSLTLVNHRFSYAATPSLYRLAVEISNNGWEDHCPAALLIEHNNVPILARFLFYGLKPTVYIKKHMFMAPKLHPKLTRYTFLHLSLLFASEVELTERYAVLDLLLQHGANVNARDRSGRTPLHWASGYADELPECMILLLEKGANLNGPDIKGRTPLQTAVRYNAEQAVELLLKRGADTEAVNWKGLKALEIARRRGHRDCEELLLKYGAL